MEKKKVVSIEDRIPKLKQARRKKANRRLIFYLSIFFILISIIVYLQSPLSHIREIEVKGNNFLLSEEIVDISQLTTETNIWTIDQQGIVEALEGNEAIRSAQVDRKLPWTVEIVVQEYNHIGYVKDESSYHPVLHNGKVLSSIHKSTIGDGPLLSSFTDEEYLSKMASQLDELPQNIYRLISEVTWQPTELNKNKILLYMNDGFIVDGTIRNFSEKMLAYPSIVSQLDPGEKGIIHIGVGSYFEKLEESPSTDE